VPTNTFPHAQERLLCRIVAEVLVPQEPSGEGADRALHGADDRLERLEIAEPRELDDRAQPALVEGGRWPSCC
jgi:hypothetical protein